MNRSRCRLGADSSGSKEACIRCDRGRMNPFSAARSDEIAMRPFVNILRPLFFVWTWISKYALDWRALVENNGHFDGLTAYSWKVRSKRFYLWGIDFYLRNEFCFSMFELFIFATNKSRFFVILYPQGDINIHECIYETWLRPMEPWY